MITKWEALPDYGEHMTLQEFEQCCKGGLFTADDGTGYYATENQMSNVIAWPADFRKGTYKTEPFTHVMWFNK